jgi:hypothetical protein
VSGIWKRDQGGRFKKEDAVEMISTFKTKSRDWAKLWVKNRRTKDPRGGGVSPKHCQILGEEVIPNLFPTCPLFSPGAHWSKDLHSVGLTRSLGVWRAPTVCVRGRPWSLSSLT